MRRLVTVSVLVLVLVSTWVATLAAAGGGAVWEFERYHEPGDHVEATTAVAWGHHASLGTPQDGPYFVYLAPVAVEFAWPEPPEEALLVGLVEVREGPYQEGEFLMGPHHAIARFEIPDIEPGSYQILHCNDPCTTTLGDIVGSWDLRVLAGTEGRPPDVIAAEVRESARNLPLFYPEYPSTTIAPELASEPAVHPAVASPSDPVRESFALQDGDEPAPSGPTRTATVDHLLAADAGAPPSPEAPASPSETGEGGVTIAWALVVGLVIGLVVTARLLWNR